jgi:hypothetical protein
VRIDRHDSCTREVLEEDFLNLAIRTDSDLAFVVPNYEGVCSPGIAANKRDIPYQSLIKVWLDEKLKQSA